MWRLHVTPADTDSVSCRLTVENPVQIIQGFIDVCRLGPGP